MSVAGLSFHVRKIRRLEVKMIFEDLLQKLRDGWTLQIWRNTTPHNVWLEGPDDEIHLEGKDRQLFKTLRERCKLQKKEGVVQYPAMFGRIFQPTDEGMAAHEIWEYDPSKEAPENSDIRI